MCLYRVVQKNLPFFNSSFSISVPAHSAFVSDQILIKFSHHTRKVIRMLAKLKISTRNPNFKDFDCELPETTILRNARKKLTIRKKFKFWYCDAKFLSIGRKIVEFMYSELI